MKVLRGVRRPRQSLGRTGFSWSVEISWINTELRLEFRFLCVSSGFIGLAQFRGHRIVLFVFMFGFHDGE